MRRVTMWSCLCSMLVALGCGGDESAVIHRHEKLDGTLWIQTAAEYAASTRQVFLLAQLRLDHALDDPGWTAAVEQDPAQARGLPPAVIVDVDETVLDNSAFQARVVVDGLDFDRSVWAEWLRRAAAPPVPGAGEFLSHAHAAGVAIFYVTNRDASFEAETRRNLRNAGFPVATDHDAVLMRGERQWTSDKSARREEVAQTHRVVLLLGDDLNDFVSGGHATRPGARRDLAQAHHDAWGVTWLVLPNPLYGSWEASLFGRDFELPYAQKVALKHAALEPFEEEQRR